MRLDSKQPRWVVEHWSRVRLGETVALQSLQEDPRVLPCHVRLIGAIGRIVAKVAIALDDLFRGSTADAKLQAPARDEVGRAGKMCIRDRLAPDLRCPRRPLDETQLLPSSQSGGYLEMLNLFRIIACLAVVGQHSFIWTNMTGNFVGTGFIAMLHLSRTAFFFLTALVVCYAQITHPRTLGGFWKRRYWEVGVPYLAWTGIYLIFSLITVSGSWDEVGRFLRHNLLLGFSQMYFVIVLFQFYLVFPLLLKLFQATRRHGLVLAISLGLATVLGLFLHYPAWFAPLSNFNRAINAVWPWSRNILVYQVFLVAGMLVALHLDEVLAFVGRHYRKIWTFTVVIGILMVFWYVFSVWSGTSIEDASDIYEPQATLWCLAAIAGIFSLCWLSLIHI